MIEQIESDLSKLELQEQIELIANLLVRIGVRGIDHDRQGSITPDQVVEIIIKDLEVNGETLANALARQGLIMLQWLEDGC